MPRWAMIVDLRKCNGCGGCAVSCQEANRWPAGTVWRSIAPSELDTPSGPVRLFVPLACMHCSTPPCADVCPTGATRQRSDGIVDIDPVRCMGCGFCVVACPYMARTLVESGVAAPAPTGPHAAPERAPAAGTCVKCDFCAPRLDQGLARGLRPGTDRDATPSCVNACVAGAVVFGDRDDPESAVSRLLREERVVCLNDELGTQPSVYYITP